MKLQHSLSYFRYQLIFKECICWWKRKMKIRFLENYWWLKLSLLSFYLRGHQWLLDTFLVCWMFHQLWFLSIYYLDKIGIIHADILVTHIITWHQCHYIPTLQYSFIISTNWLYLARIWIMNEFTLSDIYRIYTFIPWRYTKTNILQVSFSTNEI